MVSYSLYFINHSSSCNFHSILSYFLTYFKMWYLYYMEAFNIFNAVSCEGFSKVWSFNTLTSTRPFVCRGLDYDENIARIANAVPVTLYSRVTVNVESVVLNCQKYNQCLKCHKSHGLFFEDVLHLSLSFSFSLYLSLSLSFCWSGHVSSSLWSKVSKVTSL